MRPWIYLDRAAQAPGRPFTDPGRSAEDLTVMIYMADRLYWILSRSGELTVMLRPLRLDFQEADGRKHRVVVARPDELLLERDLTVVGFFGQKRAEADPALFGTFDQELIDEFGQNPDILSYSSLQLPCGNWGNLVLFSRPEAKQQWGASPKHTYVAHELAPSYYTSIRLHNGQLPSGLVRSEDLTLQRTKYFDFRENGWWQAVREVQPDPAGE